MTAYHIFWHVDISAVSAVIEMKLLEMKAMLLGNKELIVKVNNSDNSLTQA